MSDLIQLQPYDEFNRQLEANVHPPDWTNPVPTGRYNLVVVGAGTAGLVAAISAAGLGAKVALIEQHLLGGDCLNVGCVPSKAIIASGRIAAAVRHAATFGINVPAGVTVDFAEVMQRMRRLRSGIAPHDSAARFRDAGVDVYLGRAEFVSRHSVEVSGEQLRFKKAVIATGARAAELPIPGFADAGVLTNESVFSLTELPGRLVVIGGGPIGCEMAQTFARLGSRVTQIEKSQHILPREESEAALVVQQAMQRDGVEMLLETETVRIERDGDERVVFVRNHHDQSEESIRCDHVLAGIGRTPNVDGMGLEAAGIKYDLRSGIEVNDRLQTSNPDVFAAGDVASKYKFTHAADFMARIVVQNALFFGRSKVSRLLIPWSTYTSPELAHVGKTAEQAQAEGTAVDTFTVQLSEVDRAILEDETDGFVRVHVKRGTDRIVGATIVASHAGDMISELTLAMNQSIGLKKLANSIHPYPTQAEAMRKLGDQYNRTRLTPTVAAAFRKWLQWTR